ncbi:hypothetical protein OG225_16645 [Nocardia sp. NBC_01377]
MTAVDGLFENIGAAGGDLLGLFNDRFQNELDREHVENDLIAWIERVTG